LKLATFSHRGSRMVPEALASGMIETRSGLSMKIFLIGFVGSDLGKPTELNKRHPTSREAERGHFFRRFPNHLA